MGYARWHVSLRPSSAHRQCTGFISTYGGFIGLRFTLGAAESIILPGLSFWLSRFYKRHEFVARVSAVCVGAPIAGMFGGLLAYALEFVTVGKYSTEGLVNWRSILIVEGASLPARRADPQASSPWAVRPPRRSCLTPQSGCWHSS